MINKELIVSVITYNSQKFIKDFLISVLENDILPENILVFDNNSSDQTINLTKEVSDDIKITKSNQNLGYAKSINKVFENTSSKYVLICNADIKFEKNSILKLYNEIKSDDDTGCIGPQQYYPNKNWQKSGGNFPSFTEFFKNFFLINYIFKKLRHKYFKKDYGCKLFLEYLDGAAMFINREKFNLVGGFDENYFFYTEEVDFFFKLKEKKIKYYIFTPSKIMHYRGGHSVNKNFENDKKYIQYKILSRIFFVKKFRSKIYAKIFIIFEYFYFLYFSNIFKILNFFNKKFNYNYLFFKYSAKVLLNEIKK